MEDWKVTDTDSGGSQVEEDAGGFQNEAAVNSGCCELDEKTVEIQEEVAAISGASKEADVNAGGCQLEEKPLEIQLEVPVNAGGCLLDEKTVEIQKEVVVNSGGGKFGQKTMEDRPEVVVSYSGGQREEYSSNCKLGLTKKLASEDGNTRGKAMTLLKSWLVAQKDVADEDLKKIWKGLFSCLWHAEKKPLQADLIERIASLLENLDLKLSRQYFKAFLLQVRQEWSGIHHLQRDRFYLLLKQFLRHLFIVLENNDWDSELTKGFMEDLTDQAFLADVEYSSQGINFHIADVYLSELQGFLPVQLETFALLIEPFFSVMAKASDKSLLKRVKEGVFDCLLENSQNFIHVKKEGKSTDDKVETLGSMMLTAGIRRRLFKLATFSSTLQANRKVLYELHEEFSKLARLLTGSGVSIYFPRAKKPKVDENLSVDTSSEVSDLATEELVDCAIACPVQEVDATENVQGSSQVGGKKGLNGIDGCSTEKSKANACSDLCKKALQWKEVKNGVDEVGLNSADFVTDPGSLVKEGETLGFRSYENSLGWDDSLISSLEQQFEKVGAEMDDGLYDCSSPPPSLIFSVSPLSSGSQKRKRVINSGKGVTAPPCSIGGQENEGSINGSVLVNRINSETKIIGQKSVKKVRFQLKNNLVWKPYNPLPPESLRVPPSATPRGSALKKGVPPGPICCTIKDSPSPKMIVSRKRCTVVRRCPKTSKSPSPKSKLLGKQR